ncbi:major facilitator superfamily domain-containing protein [Dactylonectria estremocensis]|uniref:Major facilitator superfamily domain-containing protein n=1 Tax=Dactylonectria estremocensis TaxID=1079267 RepID=A0A9P9DQN5_9HYPO|nr:major facilitator superfamily domain-containing protein [Dactylonectria estremocensis]
MAVATFSDEKQEDALQSNLVGSEVDDDSIQWTEEEEQKLVRKVDLLVMPLLILGFFALQLDRGNIGNALTDNFFVEVGITQNQYNVGQQLLSLGIILLEIPSNLVLYRVGPTLWIGGQIIAWGLVATFQAFQKGLGPYMATRLLLGLCEAGFIPASLYTMTRWYKRSETSKRFSWFFIGNMGASAMTGIIAYGMQGVAGLSGWQWLFILEGIFTLLVGIAFLLTFPNNVSNPVSLLRYQYFTERETQILSLRVLRDDPSKAQVGQNVTSAELISALTNWRLIPHVGFTMLGISPGSAFGSYAPSLVNSFGFGRLESNALVSIGSWGLLFLNLLWGWASDKMNVRGPMVTLGLLFGLGFNIGNRILVHSENGDARFALLILSIAFSLPWHAVNGAWLSLNAKTPGERSVTLAIHIMAANCSGLIGKQLFRSEDAPLYPKGFTIIVGITAAAVVLSMIANLQYYLGNGRKLARSGLKWSY